MKIDSLWFEAKPVGKSATITVRLGTCPNCGKIKVTSNPCGFDHLAAIMEFSSRYQGAL